MLRYVAIIWNAADRDSGSEARRLAAVLRGGDSSWRTPVGCNGLEVLVRGKGAHGSRDTCLARGAGVVLGTLFGGVSAENEAPRRVSLDEDESLAIVSSRGRRLIERYWGRYVAFLHDERSGETCIVRDPAGGLPCFITGAAGIRVCFSYMADCLRAGLHAFHIDWGYIARHACFEVLREQRTALAEVTEILPGCRGVVTAGSLRIETCWRASVSAASAAENPIEAEDAAARLRGLTRACVRAWASEYRSILHKLSGGLDSAIVLACLRDIPDGPRIVCVNDHSVGSDTDERAFARIAAERASVRLIERARGSGIRLERMLQMARAPNPTVCQGCALAGPSDGALAREVGADAVFGGRGGDQLFLQSGIRLTAADYLRRRGPDPGFFRIVLAVARTEDPSGSTSIWTVMRHALRHAWFGHPFDARAQAARHRVLLGREALTCREKPDETASASAAHALEPFPGKAWHVHQLGFPEPFYDLSADPEEVEPVHPLRSQPLIEFCLGLPTHRLMDGGRERGLARRAFTGDVPTQILSRRVKGGLAEHLCGVVRADLGFVRELLLDGLLVKRGILDRRRLETALCGDTAGLLAPVEEILDHLNTEAWLRGWPDALRCKPA